MYMTATMSLTDRHHLCHALSSFTDEAEKEVFANNKNKKRSPYQPDLTNHGEMSRRTIFIDVTVDAVPTSTLLSLLTVDLTNNNTEEDDTDVDPKKRRKILIYSNSKMVAEGTLRQLSNKALKMPIRQAQASHSQVFAE